MQRKTITHFPITQRQPGFENMCRLLPGSLGCARGPNCALCTFSVFWVQTLLRVTSWGPSRPPQECAITGASRPCVLPVGPSSLCAARRRRRGLRCLLVPLGAGLRAGTRVPCLGGRWGLGGSGARKSHGSQPSPASARSHRSLKHKGPHSADPCAPPPGL